MDRVRILFVDDEAHLLAGLRRMLRDRRSEWDMRFAASGSEALSMLDQEPADVVVSDMRMPEMDGAELLSTVRNRHPDTIRIILSGYAENEAILKSVGPSHQYLAKPCAPEKLRMTVTNALEIRSILNRPQLRTLASSLSAVPAPSAAYHRLMEATASNATTSEIAAIIGEDIALATQTLKLTNSAYFALPQKLTNIEQAVRLLGLDTLRALVLVAGFYETYDENPSQRHILETLNARSLSIGRLAKKICQSEGAPDDVQETAFCAGLLAHIGTLILVTNLPDHFEKATRLVDENYQAITAAERAVFGADHTELGAYLLGLWAFPWPVVEAIAHHHAPRPVIEGAGISASMAVHAAQYITRASRAHAEPGERFIKSDIDTDTLQDLGQAEKLSDWSKFMEEGAHV